MKIKTLKNFGINKLKNKGLIQRNKDLQMKQKDLIKNIIHKT